MYNFCPKDSGLSRYMGMNVLIFADCEDHASAILREMLLLKNSCEEKHYQIKGQYSGRRPERDKTQFLLDNEDKWAFKEAPKNQMYLVGWADNDTI